MNKRKVLFLDYLVFDSSIQVGSQKYAKLFRKNGYDVFSLSHFINICKFISKNSRDREKIELWEKGVQTTKEGIYFYPPLSFLPYLNFPFLDNLKIAHNCLKFCYPNLKKILENENFIDIDILFINNISLFSVLKFVKPKMIIYRISDRVEAFMKMPKTILRLQEEVIKSSDLVFATSQNLQQEASRINGNTFYLPNGVDREFIMEENNTCPYPEEYKNITKPIVLYIGVISDWFDYNLYEYGIAKLKDISFVMIGPVSGAAYKENLKKVRQYAKTYPNFFYLGPKKHSELKKYLTHADIGIIPFKINSLTNEINPVKLFEYFAYGLPVVASSMKELYNYREDIFLYDDRERYVDLISNSIVKKNQVMPKLIELARNNTWEKRFEYIVSKLESIQKTELPLIFSENTA